MKTALALLAFVACATAAASTVTYAGYWDFDTADCTSTAETSTTIGDGLTAGYFFPVSTCTTYNYFGGAMFYTYFDYYNFTCNSTHITYDGYDDEACTELIGGSYSGVILVDNCATDHNSYNYDCITEWPTPDDFDSMDIFDEYGGTIEVAAALNYFNDSACGNNVAVVGGGWESCQFPYHTYCDGGDLYVEYCSNANFDCGSGCTNDGTFAPDGPLVDGTCYTTTNLPSGWSTGLTGLVFEVELDSYYLSANLLSCEGSGSSDAVSMTVSFGVVALAAALAL